MIAILSLHLSSSFLLCEASSIFRLRLSYRQVVTAYERLPFPRIWIDLKINIKNKHLFYLKVNSQWDILSSNQWIFESYLEPFLNLFSFQKGKNFLFFHIFYIYSLSFSISSKIYSVYLLSYSNIASYFYSPCCTSFWAYSYL